MTRLDLLSRLTSAALVALVVTLGVWLTGSPLTAAPDARPVKITLEPILALPPALPTVAPTTIEMPVEVEVATPAAVPEPPAVEPTEPRPQPQPACRPRRRGLFGRRR